MFAEILSVRTQGIIEFTGTLTCPFKSYVRAIQVPAFDGFQADVDIVKLQAALPVFFK
jgi:hypothetical protein